MRLRTRFRAARLVAAAALIWWSAPATSTGQSRADRRLQEQLDEANRREAEALVDLADRLMAGRPVESEFRLGWRHDFLKAQAGTFVPFTVTVDGGAVEARNALLYVRVARRGEPPVAARASEGKQRPRFAFDAVFPADLDREGDGAVRISRGFAVAPGDYDVVIVLRERPANPLASRPGHLKAAVLQQPLSVPDFWTGELAASTVMLADRIDALPQPLGPDEAVERPYVIGQNDVHLAADSTFRKDRELIVVFVIYNPSVAADRRFDIRVDYHLYRRVTGNATGGSEAPPPDVPAPRPGERYVTRTDPQRFNTAVLGERVDPAAGHPVMAGQGILLSSFEAGEYRLGITVTDLLSRKTLTRDVTFKVVGS